MENLAELDALFDNILLQIENPEAPPVKNPFEEAEDKKIVRFRSITPITVVVSDDKLSASVFVSRHENADGGGYTLDELKKEIEARGIRSGIDESALERMAEEQIFNSEVVFAAGVPAVDGIDGQVEVVAQEETDLKEGDVICRIVPAQDGTDGYDVYGNVLHAKNGEVPDIPQGKNTAINGEHNALVAAASGRLFFEDGVFSVRNEYVVRGDLKKPDDRITFSGDVTIYGNINEGAIVQAGGTVYVRGSITGASVYAKRISADFTVRNSTLNTKGGDIKLMNCVDSKIECDGNLEVSSLLNCSVFCAGDLTCLSGQGSVCGGTVTCVSKITCQVAGSHMHEPTTLVLGNCGEHLAERETLRQKIAVIDEDIERLNACTEEIKARKAENGTIPKKDEDFLNAAVKIKLQKTLKKEPLQHRLDHVERVIGKRESSALKVTHTLYPGVFITVGSQSSRTDTEYGKVTVYSTANGLVFS